MPSNFHCVLSAFWYTFFMNPEEKELLERTLKISEENNKILKSIRRAGRFSFFFKMFYWLLIIGIGLGSYYFIEPYLKQMTDTYLKINSTVKSFNK
ncbi:MAG: hypothetical protein AAB736_02555 [Patescibacteria group bacterium]